MANYVKSTNFAIKDGLPTGNPNKIVKGTEIDVEFSAIAGAVASKADINSPTFVGTPAAPTAATGTDTTQIATTEFVNNSIEAERDAEVTLTLKTLTSPTINGGLITNANITGGSISSLTTPLAVPSGGTGRNTLTANNLIVGNGASAVNFIAPGANGQVLTSNGTSWSSQALPEVSTTTVLNLTADASVGSVGTYAFLSHFLAFTEGATYAGSSLSYTAIWDTRGGFTDRRPPGTWRAMGASSSGNAMATVWLRIS